MNLDPYHIPYTKTTSKWIKDLNVGPKILNFPEESMGGKLPDISLGKDFLDLPSKQRQQKQK